MRAVVVGRADCIGMPNLWLAPEGVTGEPLLRGRTNERTNENEQEEEKVGHFERRGITEAVRTWLILM